jgi:hypothetical protein
MTTHNKKITKLPVVSQKTCYELTEAASVSCKRKACRKWIEHDQGKNCLFITTQMGPLTLNEVGNVYGLTRMRICQIEKNIYQKIRDFIH